MSGGSQHNPNGRQSQMSSGWSPLQLQMANLLARAPQAHMASERGVTWHTPTPPPHLYHVPVPSPPHLQAIKGAAANSVFRHTATPPELFRHTPTPPDKHLLSRHTPSPGDVKAGPPMSPADMYPHLGPTREKLRPEDLLAAAYARGGVDLSISRTANGSPSPINITPALSAAPALSATPAVNAAPLLNTAPAPPPPAAPALSVRDAPTINSLIGRASRGSARVDALIERLAPAPPTPPTPPAPPAPPSVIVQRRPATLSPPSSNEDSVDSSSGAGKRKRKPDRTLRLPAAPAAAAPAPAALAAPAAPPAAPAAPPAAPSPHSVPSGRESRASSAETIAEIAAMIASGKEPEPEPEPPQPDAPDTLDKLKSVLGSPTPDTPPEETAAAPKHHRNNSESANVPVESPSEGKPAEPEANLQPTAASFVEVENQLKKMFAGLEEEEQPTDRPAASDTAEPTQPKRRRKSAPTKGDPAHRKKQSSTRRSSATDDPPRRKQPRNKVATTKKKETHKEKDTCDSGSNASSSKSRGPYIQVRGPGASPASVRVRNAAEEEEARRRGAPRPPRAPPGPPRNGLRARGLHASTLSLRYDATTADCTWLCAFCNRGPHADSLGDLFGPYTVSTDCEEFRAAQESGNVEGACGEVWVHGACALWAPGLLAAGTRLWGLDAAVWGSRASRCGRCGRGGAGVACAGAGCGARAHLPCARAAAWSLHPRHYRALCPAHAPPAAPGGGGGTS